MIMKFGSGKGMHDLTKPLGKYTEKPTSFRSTLLEQLTELGNLKLASEGLSALKPLLQYVQIKQWANLYILEKNEMLFF